MLSCNPVVLGEHYGGLVSLGLLEVHQGVGYDYNRVAHLAFPCRRAVKAYAAAAALALDDLRLKAFAVVVVHYLHLFARY